MTTFTHQLDLHAANTTCVGPEARVSFQKHRCAEHRLMLVIALLVGAVLVSSLADAYIMAEALPDLTTFAGRV